MVVGEIEVRDIPGFSGYAISRDGRVWSKSRRDLHIWQQKLKGKWLKPGVCKSGGHLLIVLRREGKSYPCYIHRLVLETYVGPCPPGMECRHLDGDPRNNNLENLCWGTHAENQSDKVRHGTSNKGEKSPSAKLSERDVRMIIYMWRTGLFLQREIAGIYGVSKGHIKDIIHKKRWGYLWIL